MSLLWLYQLSILIFSVFPVYSDDIGLRAYDGDAVLTIACEPASSSPLQITKNGVTYGVALGDPANPSCSTDFRVKTSSGIKAILQIVNVGDDCQVDACCVSNNCAVDLDTSQDECVPADHCVKSGAYYLNGNIACVSGTNFRQCQSEGVWSSSFDCGMKDCSPNNIYFISGTQSSTTTSTCSYRSYNSIQRACTADTCGDPACTSFSDAVQNTAGTCRYISGCSGATPGSVSNYANGTSCGTYLICNGSGSCVSQPLYGSNHTAAQCTGSGGTVVNLGGNLACRFNASSCPGGWSSYSNYTTTSNKSCSGIVTYSNPYSGSYNCGTSCSTGGHGFSSAARETCTYRQSTSSNCAIYSNQTCYANITQVGCY